MSFKKWRYCVSPEDLHPVHCEAGDRTDDTELFRQFRDNESFRRWLTDTVFSLTYEAR